MNNAPLIDTLNQARQELLLIDSTIGESKLASCSEGWVESSLESIMLAERYPELFHLGFARTMIDRKEEEFIVGQYFRIGTYYSMYPHKVPGFVDVEEEIVGGAISCQMRSFDFVDRDLSRIGKRNIFNGDEIRDIAERTFRLMIPECNEDYLDYDQLYKEIEAERAGAMFSAPDEPEDRFLEMLLSDELNAPSWSHLSHLWMNYIGTVLFVPPKAGSLPDARNYIVENVRRFYSALSETTKQSLH